MLRELGSLLSSAFDPDPIAFRYQDEVGVRTVRTACQQPDATLHILKRPLNRNAFLVGCLDFTGFAELEHLIVGLGLKYGTTTRIVRILHSTGSASSVQVLPPIQNAIVRHLSSEHRAEAIVFHNHPKNPINSFFDNPPLASDADRSVFIKNFLKPESLIKTLTGGGRLRCYIGENGYVREIRAPQLLDLIQFFVRQETPP